MRRFETFTLGKYGCLEGVVELTQRVETFAFVDVSSAIQHMGKAVSQTDGFNELRGMPASEKSCLILMLLAS